MEQTLLDFLRRQFASTIGRATLDADTPLFSSGIVDSFGVLELIAFIKDTFGVDIDPGRHELSEFDTVRKTVALVARLRGAGA